MYMSVYSYSKEDIKSYAELQSTWLIESEEGSSCARKSTQSEAKLLESVLFSALDAIRQGYDEEATLEVAENIATNYRDSMIDGFNTIWERAIEFLTAHEVKDYSIAVVEKE
jgi:hypothetical protein